MSDNTDFAALLDEYDAGPQKKNPKVGQMISGKILSIGTQNVFVDIGAKSEGILDLAEVLDSEGKVTVNEGDTIEARVVETDGKAGGIVLQRKVSRGADAASALGGAFEHGLPVEGVVQETIKGGFNVQVAGMRAFCPVSQIDSRYVEDPEVFVGKRFDFVITKLEPGRGKNMNVVVSRRQLLEKENAVKAAEIRKTLEIGKVMTGVVTTLKDYGAFVDLGGLEGLVHISEMGHHRISHPSEKVAVGDKVEVQIKAIEPPSGKRNEEKISLSMKSMEASPWLSVGDKVKAGSKMTGVITRLQPFGAFVEIAPGLEGLVHISQLGADRRINHPSQVVKEGQSVEVKVVLVDTQAQRISLSMNMNADPDRGKADSKTIQEANAKSGGSMGTFADLLKGKV